MNTSARTVCLLEDSDLDFELQVLALKEIAPDVQIVRAGDCTAAAAFLDVKPDLVVIDINLPTCNGLAYLERLAECPGLSAPVVVFSTSTSEADRERAAHAGAVGYHVKPLAATEYIRTVKMFASPHVAAGTP